MSEQSIRAARPIVFCLSWVDQDGKKQRRFYLSRDQAEKEAKTLTVPYEITEQNFR